MNILLLVTGLANDKNPSGSSYNNRFANGLKENGLNVTIIHLRAISPFRNFIKIKKIDNNITVFEVSCFLLYNVKKMPTFIPFLFIILTRYLKYKFLLNFDIIHAICGSTVAAAFILNKELNIPMLSQYIGSDIAINATHYKNSRLFKYGIEESSVLCFNSEALKNEFEKFFSVPNKKLVIYRGVNLDEFKYDLNIEKGKIKIIFLGGFPTGNPNLKGGLTLLKAIRFLSSVRLTKKIELKIGGPNSLSEAYVNQLNLIDKNDNIYVEFIGQFQRQEVVSALSNSNIVLIPSLSEGIPNVLFEAMASGNAVIASNVGGISEFINESTGVLIDSDNSIKLAHAIADLVNTEDKIVQLAEHSRLQISQHDYKNFINKYISLYNL